MVSLFYLLAKKDGKEYEKLAKELFRTRSYKYNSYTINPRSIVGIFPLINYENSG
jgi:hypothetical protein